MRQSGRQEWWRERESKSVRAGEGKVLMRARVKQQTHGSHRERCLEGRCQRDASSAGTSAGSFAGGQRWASCQAPAPAGLNQERPCGNRTRRRRRRKSKRKEEEEEEEEEEVVAPMRPLQMGQHQSKAVRTLGADA